jgi:hypothetical protein
MYVTLAVFGHDPNQPGVTTHFAVLHELPAHVGLQIELDLFSAVRARDEKTFFHGTKV